MASISVEPCTFALFGALGDLALRKLFPALYQLDRADLLHADTRVLALAREPGSAEEHLASIEAHLQEFVPAGQVEVLVLQRFLARLRYVHVDFLKAE
ncbi:MAG: glucose-6-phosphate dehydrogenase, partial [Pseudomonas sp.]